MLEALHPGRIDLGIGRAPGSDQLTAAALAYPRPQADVGEFPQQVVHLLGFLTGAIDPNDPFDSSGSSFQRPSSHRYPCARRLAGTAEGSSVVDVMPSGRRMFAVT